MSGLDPERVDKMQTLIGRESCDHDIVHCDGLNSVALRAGNNHVSKVEL